jgi:hypothetical protein
VSDSSPHPFARKVVDLTAAYIADHSSVSEEDARAWLDRHIRDDDVLDSLKERAGEDKARLAYALTGEPEDADYRFLLAPIIADVISLAEKRSASTPGRHKADTRGD